MSDKYYLHDCNSYTHCYNNTYRIWHKDLSKNLERIDRTEDETPEPQKPLKWWQRLWEQDTQTVISS